MNDVIFSKSFRFLTIMHDKYHYTDNRAGTNCHYFAKMCDGTCKIVYGEKQQNSVEIPKGNYFYIPLHCSYQSYWFGNPKIHFISLGFQFLPNGSNRNYPPQVIEAPKMYDNTFESLSVCRNPSPKDIGTFYTLCGALMPYMQSDMICKTKQIVEAARETFVQNPHISVKELAKNLAVSEASLYAAFQKSSVLTLNQLRNSVLLEKAKEKLISTDLSVEEISDKLKFSSSSYFRKKFKDYFHVSPREMRKQNKI